MPSFETAQHDHRFLVDCYHGRVLAGNAVNITMEPGGVGCVAVLNNADSKLVRNFLAQMKRLTSSPLQSISAAWHFKQQELFVAPAPAQQPPQQQQQHMVKVPSTHAFRFKVVGTEIEPLLSNVGTAWIEQKLVPRHKPTAISKAVDVQFPWEDHPQRSHDKVLQISSFYIDKWPVTNARYAEYLAKTGYVAEDTYGWLPGWSLVSGGTPQPPRNGLQRPVTGVGIEEARAFCAWLGHRLPTSWEWQYAAQGLDGRRFPWGNHSSNFVPAQQHGRDTGAPPDVAKHPDGASPFGVQDLVGTVWQWTDEFRDARTRAAVLRGSAWWSAVIPPGQGINSLAQWYFPRAKTLFQHSKLLLMGPTYDRAATIGFRCAVDA